jgi:hypothetical protein
MYIYGDKRKKEKTIGLKEKYLSDNKYEVFYKNNPVGFISRKEKELKIKNGPVIMVQNSSFFNPWPAVFLDGEKLDMLWTDPDNEKELIKMGIDRPSKKFLVTLPLALFVIYIFTGPRVTPDKIAIIFDYIILSLFILGFSSKKIFKKDIWNILSWPLLAFILGSMIYDHFLIAAEVRSSLIFRQIIFVTAVLGFFIVQRTLKKKEA